MKKLGKRVNSIKETIEAYMGLCYCSCYCGPTTDTKAIVMTLEKIGITTVEVEP